MVANQGYLDPLIKPKDFLKKLKKSANGKYFVGVKDWNDCIRTCFDTFHLSKFLRKGYDIKVPAEQQWLGLLDGDMQREIARSKEITASKKIDIVKKEKIAVQAEAASPSRRRPAALSLAPTAAEKELTELDSKQQRFEKIVQRNAEKLAAEQEQEEDYESKQVALFVNPLTAATADERVYCEASVIEIQIDGEDTMYYAIENESDRKKRMMAWGLLLWTIPDVDRAITRSLSVSVGDVHGLYTAIRTYLSKDNKKEHIKESLDKRLKEFTFVKGELFKTFAARFFELQREMEQVGLVVDCDLLNTRLRKVLMSASHDISKTYMDTVMSVSEQVRADPSQLLEAMKKPMELRERFMHLRESEEGELQGSGSESEEDERKKERIREKRRKERQKKKEKKKEQREQAARVLAAQQGKDYSRVKGVCSWYQDEKCHRGDNCTFEHRKLSKADKALLLDFMKQKRESKASSSTGSSTQRKVCFECGDEGHIRPQCPKLKQAARVKHTQSTSKSVKHMSKEEREELMRELLEWSEKEKEE